MLNELDPTGAAGREHRKCAAVLNSFNKLVCLFDNREVGCEVHVEYGHIFAEAADSGCHLALNVCADREIEALAESCLDGRSGVEDDLLVGICDSLPDLVFLALLLECANGAAYYALTAANAGRISKALVECTADVSVEASLYSADS